MDTLEDKTVLPGSEGEHEMQRALRTEAKANDFYQRQMRELLAPSMQKFIQKQEMVFISTSDAKGECDCSFRSGQAGFVLVLDDKTLAYAECRGNGVMASMGNIHENAHIGMLFIDFLEDKVGLHVNGKARIMDKEEFSQYNENHPIQKPEEISPSCGEKIVSWIVIEVEEAYIHCSKNIPLLQKSKIPSDTAKQRPVDYFKLQ